MRSSLKKLLLSVSLLALLGVPAFAQTRVATVDLSKVFTKYWKTEQATAALNERRAELGKTFKEMEDDWKKAKESYQKLLDDAANPAISTEEREKRKQAADARLKEIKGKEEGMVRFEREAADAVNKQTARLRKNLLDEIRVIINGKARAGSFSMVIDTGAQTYVADPSGAYYTPVLLYNNEESDLTQAVITQLNANAPVDTAPKPAEAKEEPAGKK
jgi:outer membrane protein